MSLFLKKRVIINNYQLHVKKGKMEPDIIIIISCPENRMEVYIKFILKKTCKCTANEMSQRADAVSAHQVILVRI